MNLFRFTFLTLAATFVLLIVGGTVNPTGSSLACPDWPLCYGSLFPEMVNGVEFEHTHRLVATLVGLLTTGLLIGIWLRRKTDRRLRVLAIGLFVMVALQGVLGGITVIYKLPLAVSTGHLALAMFFFLSLIYSTFRIKAGPAHADDPAPLKRGLVLVAGLAVYLQILLGAFVRHTKSGQVCDNDWLMCKGVLWPSFAPAQLHMSHRFVGVLLAFLVFAAAIAAAREAHRHDRKLAYYAAIVVPFLTLLQILLGMLTVHSRIGLLEVSAHLGVGALILATFAVIYLGLGPMAVRTAVVAPEKAPTRRIVPLEEPGRP
ncbi:MAG: COX15/CtaA family protein [Myxococcales bacterium]|nr:COX15/CtaA family protein [Myxococcales bacterium]